MIDALSATVRALSFIALFQAAGIATFVAIFGGHLVATLASTRRIGVASAVVAALLVAIHYLLEPARMGGELAGAMDPMLHGLVLHSSIATAGALRIAGLVLIIAGLRTAGLRASSPGNAGLRSAGPAETALSDIAQHGTAGPHDTGTHDTGTHGAGPHGAGPHGAGLRGSRRAADVQLGAGIVLVIFSFTFVGHTSSESPRATLQALLVLHLVVVAFWFGALVPLYRASSGESPSVAGAVTEAFSKLAVSAVPLIFVAGVALAALLLPSLDALWTTTYGQLLLVKIGAFAVLMLLGALNKWRLGPALARGDSNVASVFRRTLALEYGLIAAALSVTAVLTSFYSPH